MLSAAIARFAAACETRLEVLSRPDYLYPCHADPVFLLTEDKSPSASTREIIITAYLAEYSYNLCIYSDSLFKKN